MQAKKRCRIIRRTALYKDREQEELMKERSGMNSFYIQGCTLWKEVAEVLVLRLKRAVLKKMKKNGKKTRGYDENSSTIFKWWDYLWFPYIYKTLFFIPFSFPFYEFFFLYIVSFKTKTCFYSTRKKFLFFNLTFFFADYLMTSNKMKKK